MRNIIQRVSEANVKVKDAIVGNIDKGFLILVGIESSDTPKDIEKAVDKILGLRIFEDHEGKMNQDIKDVKGEILSVSQFTLAGSIKKGNRPSFTSAMNPIEAKELYEYFNSLLIENGVHVETGMFQEHMDVSLVNDGPVTIILDVKNGKVI